MEAVRQETSKYDDQARRRAVRNGKERGVWIFIPAAELRKAGLDPHGETPLYRTWGSRRGSVFVRLYGGRPVKAGPSKAELKRARAVLAAAKHWELI